MKINHPIKVSPSTSSISASKSKAGQLSSPETSRKSGKSGVNLSNSANFIQSLKDASQEFTSIRQELVDEARADIESGSLGSEQDYEQAITALLMEL